MVVAIEVFVVLLVCLGSCVELQKWIDSFNGLNQGFLLLGSVSALLRLILASSDGYNPLALHC